MGSNSSRRRCFLLLILLVSVLILACGIFSKEPNMKTEESASATLLESPSETNDIQADIEPEYHPTNTPRDERTENPTPEYTNTPPPPRADKWLVTFVIELEEKREVDGVERISFKDIVTIDFNFITIRDKVMGKGTGKRHPIYEPELSEVAVEGIDCPEIKVIVKGTSTTSTANIQLLDQATIPYCMATVTTPSESNYADYGPQLTAVLNDIYLEISLLDGGSAEGSGTVNQVTDTTSEIVDLVDPMAYSYQATIESFDPTTAAEWPTSIPTETQTPTSTAPAQQADATAPSPLPDSNTSEILEADSCFDFDSSEMTSGELCDLKFLVFEDTGEIIIGPVNGALFMEAEDSGSPPSMAICQPGTYDTRGYVDFQDRYLCFKTNKGYLGFFVLREDQREQERILFDWWVFASVSGDQPTTPAPTEPLTATPSSPESTITPTSEATLVATVSSGPPEINQDESLVLGTCFDFDRGEAITDDGSCDLTFSRIVSTGEIMVKPVNEAVFISIADSGNPPTLEMCQEGNAGTEGYIGIQGRYHCYITSEGVYGGFLLKEYQGQENRILFDWWMFP